MDDDPGAWVSAGSRASERYRFAPLEGIGRGTSMGSVIKKRRKKMRKHKYKKLRARNRHKRKRGK
jgi:hypothetical protein